MVTIWTQEYAKKPKQEVAEEVKEVLKEQEPPEEEVEEVRDDREPPTLDELTYAELKEIGKAQGIPKYNRMKHEDLKAAIEKKIAEAEEDFTDDEEMPFDEEPGEDVPY